MVGRHCCCWDNGALRVEAIKEAAVGSPSSSLCLLPQVLHVGTLDIHLFFPCCQACAYQPMPLTPHRRRCARIPSPSSTTDVSFLSLLNTELHTREPFCHRGLLLLVHSLDFFLLVWIGSATTRKLLLLSLSLKFSWVLGLDLEFDLDILVMSCTIFVDTDYCCKCFLDGN